MYPEDACVQMELLGHDFFVFRNAETDEVNGRVPQEEWYIWSDRTRVLDQIKKLIRIKNEETQARRDSRLVFFTQFLLPLQDHRLPVNHRKNTFLFSPPVFAAPLVASVISCFSTSISSSGTRNA